jgi:hypothetical protein
MDEISGSGCLIGRRLSDGGARAWPRGRMVSIIPFLGNHVFDADATRILGEASTPIARNFTKARLGPRAEQFDEFVVDEAGLEQS